MLDRNLSLLVQQVKRIDVPVRFLILQVAILSAFTVIALS